MPSHALIVIDMQKAYFRSAALASVQQRLITRLNELLAIAKSSDVAVFNVITEHASDQSTWTLNMREDNEPYLIAGSKETEVVDGLDINGATTISKTRDSAFFGTDLASRLRDRPIDTLILSGVSTHGCVLQTAADAYAENFRVILADEALSTHDPSYHETTLELLATEYRQVRMSNREIAQLVEKKGV